MNTPNPPHEVQGSQPPVPIHRQILSLALPALGALIAEPIFVLADSAMVGHLGLHELAGLSLASTILMTVVGLCVFLAYATTAATARKAGAGDRPGAVRDGIDGMWLALLLGLILTAALLAFGSPLARAFNPDPLTLPHALAYLRASAPGIPGMLLVLAATGVLRGLLDTKTPLIVASIGAVANIGANAALIYGLRMGVAGSGLGTALVQTAMGLALAAIVGIKARKLGVTLGPRGTGLLASTKSGVPLLIRTAALRLALLATVATATALGSVVLASHQIVNSVWGLTAFALDALAIAAQALVAQGLGASDAERVRSMLRIMVRWGLAAGAVIGIVIAAGAWLIVPLFTSSPEVRAAAVGGLIVIGILMPLAGYVFVLDGVLIGAGDGRFLAWAGILTLVAYLPALWFVPRLAPGGTRGIIWLWIAMAGVFMAARAVVLGLRSRGTAWMRLGI